MVTKVYVPPGLAGPGASCGSVYTTPLALTGATEGAPVRATVPDDSIAEIPNPTPAKAHKPMTALAKRLFMSLTLLAGKAVSHADRLVFLGGAKAVRNWSRTSPITGLL